MTFYPRFGCPFCNSDFKNEHDLNRHLDCQIPEFRSAYAVKPGERQKSPQTHPVAAIRFVRKGGWRKQSGRAIDWEEDTVEPRAREWVFCVYIKDRKDLNSFKSRKPQRAALWLAENSIPVVRDPIPGAPIVIEVPSSPAVSPSPPPAPPPPPPSPPHPPSSPVPVIIITPTRAGRTGPRPIICLDSPSPRLAPPSPTRPDLLARSLITSLPPPALRPSCPSRPSSPAQMPPPPMSRHNRSDPDTPTRSNRFVSPPTFMTGNSRSRTRNFVSGDGVGAVGFVAYQGQMVAETGGQVNNVAAGSQRSRGSFVGSWGGFGTAATRKAAAAAARIVREENSHAHDNETSAAGTTTVTDTEEAQPARQTTLTLRTPTRAATSAFSGTTLVTPGHVTPGSMPVIFHLSVRLQPGMLACVVDVRYSVTLDEVMESVREHLDADEDIWPSVAGIGWSRQVFGADSDPSEEEGSEVWDVRMWGRIKRMMMGGTGGTVQADVVWRD